MSADSVPSSKTNIFQSKLIYCRHFITMTRRRISNTVLQPRYWGREADSPEVCRLWHRTYERGYETSGSPLRFMLRRSSLVECVSVLHGNRCLQSVEFFFLQQYVQPCLLKNPKYTFYTIKSSLKLAYYMWISIGSELKGSPRGNVLKVFIEVCILAHL